MRPSGGRALSVMRYLVLDADGAEAVGRHIVDPDAVPIVGGENDLAVPCRSPGLSKKTSDKSRCSWMIGARPLNNSQDPSHAQRPLSCNNTNRIGESGEPSMVWRARHKPALRQATDWCHLPSRPMGVQSGSGRAEGWRSHEARALRPCPLPRTRTR